MIVELEGERWYRRGRGPHVVYGLIVEGDDESESIATCPVFISALRGRMWGRRSRLLSIGWIVNVSVGSSVDEIRVEERGRRGLLRAMRAGLLSKADFERLAKVAAR